MRTDVNPIILYDGVCGFCNRTVQFILKRDAKDHFRFAPLQSQFAANLLRRHGVSSQKLESVYLVINPGQANESLQVRSTASIYMARRLGPFWRVMANLLSIVPEPIRDWGYNLIARYRYRIFGKYESCPIPNPRDRHKFLDLA